MTIGEPPSTISFFDLMHWSWLWINNSLHSNEPMTAGEHCGIRVSIHTRFHVGFVDSLFLSVLKNGVAVRSRSFGFGISIYSKYTTLFPIVAALSLARSVPLRCLFAR
jgi:hypothetical protein